MSFWFVLAGALVGLSAVVFIAWRILRAYAVYEGMHACACPLDGTPALVKLRAWRAAMSALRGRPSLQVVDCLRWPERASCNRACVAELEGNCRIMARFYADFARETRRPWFGRRRKSAAPPDGKSTLLAEAGLEP